MESRNDYYTTQRIGNTLFKVRVKFAPDAHETMEEKIMRMIKDSKLCYNDCTTNESAV